MTEPSEDFDWDGIARREQEADPMCVKGRDREEWVLVGIRQAFASALPPRSRKMIAADIRAMALRVAVLAYETGDQHARDNLKSLAHIADVFGVNRQRVSAISLELRKRNGLGRRSVLTHTKRKQAGKV